jgi:hypothetical protein
MKLATQEQLERHAALVGAALENSAQVSAAARAATLEVARARVAQVRGRAIRRELAELMAEMGLPPPPQFPAEAIMADPTPLEIAMVRTADLAAARRAQLRREASLRGR